MQSFLIVDTFHLLQRTLTISALKRKKAKKVITKDKESTIAALEGVSQSVPTNSNDVIDLHIIPEAHDRGPWIQRLYRTSDSNRKVYLT